MSMYCKSENTRSIAIACFCLYIGRDLYIYRSWISTMHATRWTCMRYAHVLVDANCPMDVNNRERWMEKERERNVNNVLNFQNFIFTRKWKSGPQILEA